MLCWALALKQGLSALNVNTQIPMSPIPRILKVLQCILILYRESKLYFEYSESKTWILMSPISQALTFIMKGEHALRKAEHESCKLAGTHR